MGHDPEHHYEGFNPFLLRHLPPSARIILDVGCSDGSLGAQIKVERPGSVCYGVEPNPTSANIAKARLDRVFCANIESDDMGLAPETFDCILFGDVLEHLYDPLSVLLKARTWLKPTGSIVCSVPNVQHHSILSSLLRGEFQYQTMGLLDATHIRFFTWAGFIKLMLDAGFTPHVVCMTFAADPYGTRTGPVPGLSDAIRQGLGHLKQEILRGMLYTTAFQYVFEGTPHPASPPDPSVFPISFVVLATDRVVLADNLMSSAIFKGQHPHQILVLEAQTSVGEALENGIQQAQHAWVVYVHQDVYLPQGWDQRFCQQVTEAASQVAQAGLFGVYGIQRRNTGSRLHGTLMDRQWHKQEGGPFPRRVDALDDVLIGFKKADFPTAHPGIPAMTCVADLVSVYQETGRCAVVVEALCFHNPGLVGTRQQTAEIHPTTPHPTPPTAQEEGVHLFVEVLGQMDDTNDIPALIAWVQTSQHSTTDIMATLYHLLAGLRIRPAFLLAMRLANTGHQNIMIAVALCVGGMVFNNPTEEKRGRESLHHRMQTRPLSEAQKATFHAHILRPVLTHLMEEALKNAHYARTQQILEIMEAVAPRFGNLHAP